MRIFHSKHGKRFLLIPIKNTRKKKSTFWNFVLDLHRRSISTMKNITFCYRFGKKMLNYAPHIRNFEKMDHINKVITLFDQQQYQAALDEITLTQESGVESFELYLYQGRIYKKMGKYGDAINALNKAKSLAPTDPRPDSEIGLINSILQITNNFYYENPYTDLDLIEGL